MLQDGWWAEKNMIHYWKISTLVQSNIDWLFDSIVVFYVFLYAYSVACC